MLGLRDCPVETRNRGDSWGVTWLGSASSLERKFFCKHRHVSTGLYQLMAQMTMKPTVSKPNNIVSIVANPPNIVKSTMAVRNATTVMRKHAPSPRPPVVEKKQDTAEQVTSVNSSRSVNLVAFILVICPRWRFRSDNRCKSPQANRRNGRDFRQVVLTPVFGLLGIDGPIRPCGLKSLPCFIRG